MSLASNAPSRRAVRSLALSARLRAALCVFVTPDPPGPPRNPPEPTPGPGPEIPPEQDPPPHEPPQHDPPTEPPDVHDPLPHVINDPPAPGAPPQIIA